ncbi:nucleotide pyrophosphohydrolase [Haloferax prahovense]|uniref:nucleotide pyrophosphohydrolase n=1 Tax=Haloferax prahovense TaxID=381852 RepID=UPI000679D4A9|nr:nucleotide pyrophosphohydrolase [Haloferax prahovense]
MDFTDLNQEIRTFCEVRDWGQFHTPKDLAIGLTTESNELLEIFRFKDEHEQSTILEDSDKRGDIEDELADVLFFLLRFADLNDIDLEEALATKLEKNRERYPKEEYKSSNRKYNE